ncbi:FmdB family transcriptional regulator [Leucobacter insecticola]|uniref:FmdB family transcriptional regulator n=1 Tax=Leucobacter insecticola TaxID=2714934 RepID=A0A6G8FFV9_9MICO|nr:FmdB family zinc ribbon protein [Leucobacter insecticola]QIM15217.1 FmdB family transcriptional regulator [Leucobacter insecticola]
MPTYAYRCVDCEHNFDIYQSFSDDALTSCPECGGTLRKVFGSLGVTFNGSGFYRTDSRAGDGAKGGSGSGSSSSGSSTASASSGSSSSGSGNGSGAGSSSGA